MDLLASPADLETLSGLGVDDGRAWLLLQQASAVVRSYCGWHVAPSLTGDVVTVDGSGATVQPLPTGHLTAVTAVTSDGGAVDLTTVDWSRSGYLTLRDCARWTDRPRGVVATIDHGYDETPPEVQAVVCSIATRAAANPSGIVREQTGPFSVSYATAGANMPAGVVVLPHEAAVLHRYTIGAG